MQGFWHSFGLVGVVNQVRSASRDRFRAMSYEVANCSEVTRDL